MSKYKVSKTQYTLTLNSQDKLSGSSNNNANFIVDWSQLLPKDVKRFKCTFNFVSSAGYFIDNMTNSNSQFLASTVGFNAHQFQVTQVISGNITIGSRLYYPNVPDALYILSQASGTPNGLGVYNITPKNVREIMLYSSNPIITGISPYNNSNTTNYTGTLSGSISGNILTVNNIFDNNSSTIPINSTISGSGINTCTVLQQLTGVSGKNGTYLLSGNPQTVGSQTAYTASGYPAFYPTSILCTTNLPGANGTNLKGSTLIFDTTYVTNNNIMTIYQSQVPNSNFLTPFYAIPISNFNSTINATPTYSLVGYISGTTLTVNSITGSNLQIGTTIINGGVSTANGGTVITGFLTGTGDIGTYTINNSQTVGSSASPVTINYYNPISCTLIPTVLINFTTTIPDGKPITYNNALIKMNGIGTSNSFDSSTKSGSMTLGMIQRDSNSFSNFYLSNGNRTIYRPENNLINIQFINPSTNSLFLDTDKNGNNKTYHLTSTTNTSQVNDIPNWSLLIDFYPITEEDDKEIK
jgi:hypothetical protein